MNLIGSYYLKLTLIDLIFLARYKGRILEKKVNLLNNVKLKQQVEPKAEQQLHHGRSRPYQEYHKVPVPRELKELHGFFRKATKGTNFPVVLAGGALSYEMSVKMGIITKRDIYNSDIDLYVNNIQQAHSIANNNKWEADVPEILERYDSDFATKIIRNPNFEFFSDYTGIDIVHFFKFETPQDILDRFDFSICQAALTEDSFIYVDGWFEDLINQRFKVYQAHNIGSLLARLLKYHNKGFSFDPEQALEVGRESAFDESPITKYSGVVYHQDKPILKYIYDQLTDPIGKIGGSL